MTRSPYYLGFPTLTSEVNAQHLPIRGTFPEWLTGALIRTGPAKFEVGEHPFHHWFDGLAMLHRFAFAGGRVVYLNRYLRSQAYNQATVSGVISRREFATDPCRTLFQRVTSWFFPRAIYGQRLRQCCSVARRHRRYHRYSTSCSVRPENAGHGRPARI